MYPIPLLLCSSPPGLPLYLFTLVSSNRAADQSVGKGSLPRQPFVTEQCIRTLRHPLHRGEKKKNQSTTPGCIRGREGHLSHLSECHAGWLCSSSPIALPEQRARRAGLVCLAVFLFMPPTQEQRASFQTNH